MNLAYKYPLIFWNTANLIVDSAGVDYSSDDEENADEIAVSDDTDTTPDEADEEIVFIYEPEDWEGYEYEDLPDRSGKKKKKVKCILAAVEVTENCTGKSTSTLESWVFHPLYVECV